MVLCGTTKLPFGQQPLMLYNGVVTCQTQSGKTAEVQLDTHNFLEKHQEYPQAEVITELKTEVKWLIDRTKIQGFKYTTWSIYNLWKKLTCHPGFKSGTFSLQAKWSPGWVYETDWVEQVVLIQRSKLPLTVDYWKSITHVWKMCALMLFWEALYTTLCSVKLVNKNIPKQ